MQYGITHLLRRVGAFLKIDIIYLFRGGFWLGSGHLVLMLIAFSASIAFANLLPKETFGTYKFILSVAALIGILSFIDIGTAITQAVARGFDGTLKQGFRVNLRWGLGTLLGGVALSVYYYFNENLLLSLSFLVAGILSPVAASAGLYGAYLLGKKDFRRNAFYSIVRNAVPVAALVLTLFLTRDLLVIIIVYFLSAALVSLLLYRLTVRTYREGNGKEDPGLASYGKHLGAMGIIGQVADNLDKILVFHYLGAAPLAIYAFVAAPVEQLQGGKKILNALIFSRLSERSFEELRKSAAHKVVLLVAYASVLVGVYVLLIPYFFSIFYPQYLDSVFYSQLYALTLFGVIGSVLESNLVAHKKKRELYVIRTSIPLIRIGLLFGFIPSFGLIGLIAAQVIVRFLSGFISYFFVMRPFKN